VDESQTIRVSVEEAASLLGIEKGSVKKRIQRGKLRSEKDAAGVTWVYLDRSETVRDQSQGRSETDWDGLVGELRDRVRSLERRLDEEGESRRRADTIIAQLAQANNALTDRLRELEAPSEQGGPSKAPSALRGSWEEGAKEAARRLVGGIAGLVVAIPASLAAVISYFNNAPIETILAFSVALFGAVVGLTGTYFGIKSSADAVESAQRAVEETNTTAEQAAQEFSEASEPGEEQQGRGQSRPDAPGAQEGAQRPWWRRVFGR
jgi:hypothetical protein